MENALFYTLSTISQTLAGAIALLGAFVLYRLQILKVDEGNSAAAIYTHAQAAGATQDQVNRIRELQLTGRYSQLLQLSRQVKQNAPAQTPLEFTKSQSELDKLVRQRKGLRRFFLVSLILTVTVIAASVIALAITPYIAWEGYSTTVLVIGVIGLLACLGSYLLLLCRQV